MAEDKDWRPAAEHSGCLLRLQRLLERAQGFRLLILSHNRPKYRDNLIARLREAQPDSAVLDLRQLGSLAAFEDALAQQQVRQVHLLNLESLRKEQRQDFFKGLNYHREHIARTCGGFLLVWLPEHLIAKLAVEAADFWAWREQVFDFILPKEPEKRRYTSLVDTANLDRSAKQKRIHEIKEFLSNSSDQASLTNADLKEELGILFKSIGEYEQAEYMMKEAIKEYTELDEAESCAKTKFVLASLLTAKGDYEQAMKLLKEQILPVLRQLKKDVEEALAMGQVADILETRGKLDEALEIRKKKELPVYKRFGLERLKAFAMGKIADILVARGEFDKALRIWRQEGLPIYERLGDVREKAVTMGRIADVLQFRGQFDEALKIREQEELPVYERLGDIREQAVTKGKIADILWFCGHADEALRIREQEVLPVFEHLGDTQNLMFGRVNFAILLHDMDTIANRVKIDKLLRLALADAKRLKLPREIEWIESIMQKVAA
ncbi:hypothetical protein GCAAIG_04820 [Candidatus Electronema halotolerans]